MRSSRPELFCKNGALANFAKFTRKHQKDIPLQTFSCEFCKISHSTFFKKPFRRLLLHKHSLCLFSYHDLSRFQMRYRTFFLAEYFLGFICRLGTKVSSVCKTLSQKPISNLVTHLLHSNHKFVGCDIGKPPVDNHLSSTSQKCFEYVSKMS